MELWGLPMYVFWLLSYSIFMINVAILDDHTIFAEGLKALLVGEAQINVIGHFQSYDSLVLGVSIKQIDVLVLDMRIPETDGLAVAQKLMEIHPLLKIIVLSMFDDPALVHRMVKLGAKGYAHKGISGEDFVKMITQIYHGATIFPVYAPVASTKKTVKTALKQTYFTVLSRREKEILKLILDEQSSSQIAKELGISPKTVEGHRANIFAKLNVKNVAGLVKLVIEFGLI